MSKDSETTITPEPGRMETLLNINGVTGCTLTTGMGEVLYSSQDDDGLNEFIAFLSGMLPNIAEQAGIGTLHQAIFKNTKTGNLLMITDGEQSLGITTKPRTPTHDICQQITTLMHWG